MTHLPPELSVCIAARNRPELLVRCLNSTRWLRGRRIEILLLDDASEPPLEPVIRTTVDPEVGSLIRFLRHRVSTHYIVARNELARAAAAPFILSLDDDAELTSPAVLDALDVITRDVNLGAVAFSQARPDGRLYRPFMQPVPVAYRCYAPTFYGYAHLVRRELFLRLGGYREAFWAYGEESEFCKRVWNAGYRVVCFPDLSVCHHISPSERSERNRLRYGCRNAILGALYNEPWLMLPASIPMRLWAYWRFRSIPARHYGFSDKGGMWWQFRELARNIGRAIPERAPLRWATFRALQRLKREFPPYPGGWPDRWPPWNTRRHETLRLRGPTRA